MKKRCFAAVYRVSLPINILGTGRRPSHSSVIIRIIIVIDQSCNNGRNLWNYSVGTYVSRPSRAGESVGMMVQHVRMCSVHTHKSGTIVCVCAVCV